MQRKSNKKRGMMMVLSAPSGCGKTTVVRALMKKNKSFVRSVSLTTRKPRKGEKEGIDYYFVSKPEFLKLKKRKALLESACVFNHYYGTPKSKIQEMLRRGKNVILTIDVQGAKQIRRSFPSSVHVFLHPPSMKVLKRRLTKRKTDSAREIEKRLKEAKREIQQSGLYDYQIVNSSVHRAVKEILSIVR
jgi:guanylate kinase